MTVIYLETTLNLLVSAGKKYKVDELISKAEVKQSEDGVKYLKIITVKENINGNTTI